MKKITYLLLSLCFCGAYSQSSKLDKANAKFNNYNFIEASKIYQKVAESGYESEELYQKLGDLYYFKSQYTEAEKWYEKLYALKPSGLKSEYLLRYSQSLKATGQSKKSEGVYNEFLETSGILNDEYTSSADYLEIIAENSNRYKVESLSINSDGIDYGAFVHEGTLYFSSCRSLGKKKLIDSWSERPFLDIYSVAYNEKANTFEDPIPLDSDINTKFHECSPVLTRDGQTMYFTRTNSTPRIKKSKKERTELKIYRATKVNGAWANIEDLSINGDNYSNAHPMLSPDEKTLYFVSNMPTTIGQTDIYAVSINSNGSLGKPVNLGPKINTKGRESFPYITEDNALYFSSDGHYGLGGYDVFYIDLKTTGRQLLNVGKPINSASDDYAFSINDYTKKGFFSSNREATDNIYGFTETKPIKELLESRLKGQIVDSDTGVPVPNAVVTIASEDQTIKYKIQTDEQGIFETTLNKFKSHTITVNNKDYEATDAFLEKGKEAYEKDFKLVRNVFEINENQTDLSKLLKVKHIYFDLNKATIKEDAKVELEKIVAAMQTYPNLRINIRSHTDSRASAAYNMALSNKRAKATKDYLIKRGIAPIRLSAKGYGETQLLNTCARCTEAEHRQNRRSEFIVLQN